MDVLLAEEYGFDWLAICSQAEPDFEPCDHSSISHVEASARA